jgi:hypothetical protein
VRRCPACFATPLSSIRCFSGLPESIFHADPHAAQSHNANAEKHALSRWCFWTGARRADPPHRCATRSIALCLYCLMALAIHCTPLSEIVQQPALQGHPVPLHLILLRKSFLTVYEMYAPTQTRSQWLAGNPRVCLRSIRKRSLVRTSGAFYSRG